MKDGAKKRGGKAAKSGAQSSQTGPAADAPSGPSVADVPAGPSAEPKGGKGEKGGKGWVTKAVAMTVGVGVLAAVLMVDPFSNDYNRAEAPGYDVWTLEIMSDVNKRLNSELETVLRASYQHGRQGMEAKRAVDKMLPALEAAGFRPDRLAAAHDALAEAFLSTTDCLADPELAAMLERNLRAAVRIGTMRRLIEHCVASEPTAAACALRAASQDDDDAYCQCAQSAVVKRCTGPCHAIASRAVSDSCTGERDDELYPTGIVCEAQYYLQIAAYTLSRWLLAKCAKETGSTVAVSAEVIEVLRVNLGDAMGHDPAQFMLGQLLMSQEAPDWEEVIEVLTRAYVYRLPDTDHIEALGMLARANVKLGRHAESLELLEQIQTDFASYIETGSALANGAQADPRGQDPQGQAMKEAALGMATYQLFQLRQTVESKVDIGVDIIRAYRRFPNHLLLSCIAAVAMARQGDLAAAVRVIETNAEQYEDNAEALRVLGPTLSQVLAEYSGAMPQGGKAGTTSSVSSSPPDDVRQRLEAQLSDKLDEEGYALDGVDGILTKELELLSAIEADGRATSKAGRRKAEAVGVLESIVELRDTIDSLRQAEAAAEEEKRLEEEEEVRRPPPPVGTTRPDGDNGGWKTEHPATWGASTKCNIDRRANLTVAEFEEEYVNRNLPVIITGAFEDWPANTEWTRERFLQAHGATVINTRRTSYQAAIPNDTVTGKGQGPAEVQPMTVADFVAAIESGDSGPDADLLYFLSRSWGSKQEVIRGFAPLDLFEDEDLFPFDSDYRDERSLFYLGGPGTGVGMHSHTNAWNALVYGKKRWILMPPFGKKSDGATGRLLSVWLRDWYPKIEDEAFDCVQNAGEVLYVPTMWYHAVINIETSIGIALEVGHNDESSLAKAIFAARAAVTDAPSGAPRVLPE